MDKKIKAYYQLKAKLKELEQELASLRSDILNHMNEQGIRELAAGAYKVKLIHQERKEYDDDKLYAALPDPDVWRMLSKPDPAKITSMLKLGVISDESIQNTYQLKTVTLLQIDKK